MSSWSANSEKLAVTFWRLRFEWGSMLAEWMAGRGGSQHHPLCPSQYVRAGLSNLLHTCIFLHTWTFWFAHLDFYKYKPDPGLNPRKTSQKIWTIITHSRFSAIIFAHLIKKLDTPGLEHVNWTLKCSMIR